MFEAILEYLRAIWRWILSQHIEEDLADLKNSVNELRQESKRNTLLLEQIQAALPPQRAVAFRAYLTDKQGNRIKELVQGEIMDQKVTDPGVDIELVAVDKFGNAGAALDGPVKWSGDAAFVNVTTNSEDGLKASVTFVGLAGDTMVTAKGDGDLGPDVSEITYSLALHLMPGSAVSFQANVTPRPAV